MVLVPNNVSLSKPCFNCPQEYKNRLNIKIQSVLILNTKIQAFKELISVCNIFSDTRILRYQFITIF